MTPSDAGTGRQLSRPSILVGRPRWFQRLRLYFSPERVFEVLRRLGKPRLPKQEVEPLLH